MHTPCTSHNQEDLIDEQDKLKKLLVANFGRLKNDPIKQGKVFSEYEKLSGVKHGGARPHNAVLKITQEDIANELGVSVDTIQRLKKLQTLLPEFQDLISDGKVTATTGFKVLARLSKDEQSELLSKFGSDIIEGATQKQMQGYIEELNNLKNINTGLKMKLEMKPKEEPEVD